MTFLKNTWYVAAHGNELDDGLVSRKICNEPIVMYRTASGHAVALQDRCPHRFVPLSQGSRVGDNLQCAYHGLQFGPNGACALAPHDAAQQDRIRVKSYAVAEKHGEIWLWMGEAEQADESRIPDFDFLDNPAYAIVRGMVNLKANHQIISDNLLDLSHVHYLHPGVHQGSKFEDFTNKLKVEGETVWSMLWRHHYHLTPQMQHMSGIHVDDVEGQGHARWTSPGNMFVDTAYWEHGKTVDDGVRTPNAHLLTPETEYSTHYFWAAARNYMLDDKALDQGTIATVNNIFLTQDGPMCEAQQAYLGDTDDFLGSQPIILKADAAGVAARRILSRLKRDEAKHLSLAAE